MSQKVQILEKEAYVQGTRSCHMPVMGKHKIQLERKVEVILWTIRKSRMKSLDLGSEEELAMRDFETRR